MNELERTLEFLRGWSQLYPQLVETAQYRYPFEQAICLQEQENPSRAAFLELERRILDLQGFASFLLSRSRRIAEISRLAHQIQLMNETLGGYQFGPTWTKIIKADEERKTYLEVEPYFPLGGKIVDHVNMRFAVTYDRNSPFGGTGLVISKKSGEVVRRVLVPVYGAVGLYHLPWSNELSFRLEI